MYSIWMKQPTENNNFFYSINLIDNLIYDGNDKNNKHMCPESDNDYIVLTDN